MTKEEARLSVMGAISMALKDSTLQQGFEIICKNLAELEKENAELKTKVTALENANRAMVKELDDMTSCGVSVLENVVRSKVKAKEIIREFVEWANWQGNSKCPSFKSIQDKAEKFLKEVSE